MNADKRSFAHVYDALYGGNAAFLQAQIAFLRDLFEVRPGSLLDLGCGTGIHLAVLSRCGYSVTGVDIDPLMLLTARRKNPSLPLVLADLRRLPFSRSLAARSFDGALCLESPLAYLPDDAELFAALDSVREALRPGGKLLMDVFDYPGTLGTRPQGIDEANFVTPDMQVVVRESHRYEKRNRTWRMEQELEVDEHGERYSFTVVHVLQIRTMDEYALALESAGFTVLQALTAYPGAGEELGRERRIILVARR